jgi:N6-adenosine-specific RNA methylase IME4
LDGTVVKNSKIMDENFSLDSDGSPKTANGGNGVVHGPLPLDYESQLIKNQILADEIKEPNSYSLAEVMHDIRDVNAQCKDKETYINCDIRYFNFDFLVEKLGGFDSNFFFVNGIVLVVDPPWRIRGGQKNDSQFMFSNSKFCLEYNTMSNVEIKNLQLEKLSKKGFIFLWILANQISVASEILNKWGYELIDILVWVKLRDGKVYLSHGFYFMHSYEICLIGYKCPMGETVEYMSKVFFAIKKEIRSPITFSLQISEKNRRSLMNCTRLLI